MAITSMSFEVSDKMFKPSLTSDIVITRTPVPHKNTYVLKANIQRTNGARVTDIPTSFLDMLLKQLSTPEMDLIALVKNQPVYIRPIKEPR